ncbi:MAG: Zn-ribbon domain-containing protein [Archaeoglobaceae archaeon]|nr:Zn-ribbon domain-containing protein [Archaeoglobaceae archaeon]MCX8151638.1 Zn-ribbon domain-containing protein [Archaeoglobaceae archaeon]MDW8013084.1 Zn-ribbon domain-containing protein [Archaeoglobaceae archaeon]
MPHRCTKCEKTYADGDIRILKGCDCGNNRFIYVPKEPKERKIFDFEEVKDKKEISFKEIGFGIESIKIIAPGQYEINIEKLLERDEIVIALQENGRYIIHLPSLLKKKKGEKV